MLDEPLHVPSCKASWQKMVRNRCAAVGPYVLTNVTLTGLSGALSAELPAMMASERWTLAPSCSLLKLAVWPADLWSDDYRLDPLLAVACPAHPRPGA